MGTINTAEFDAAQAVKEASPQEQPNTPGQPTEQPTLLAGKYKTTEELEKGYKELQKKLGGASPAPQETQEETPKEPQELPPEGGSLQIGDQEDPETSTQGISQAFETATTEFVESGELTEATIESLETQGVPRSYVDQYVAGMKALQQVTAMQAHALVGGQENYTKMLQWAKVNLDSQSAQAFDKAVTSTDSYTRDNAILALNSKFTKATGTEASLIQGSGTVTGGPAAFRSVAEKQAAMADPRYRTDPVYREEVMARIMAGRS